MHVRSLHRSSRRVGDEPAPLAIVGWLCPGPAAGARQAIPVDLGRAEMHSPILTTQGCVSLTDPCLPSNLSREWKPDSNSSQTAVPRNGCRLATSREARSHGPRPLIRRASLCSRSLFHPPTSHLAPRLSTMTPDSITGHCACGAITVTVAGGLPESSMLCCQSGRSAPQRSPPRTGQSQATAKAAQVVLADQ